MFYPFSIRFIFFIWSDFWRSWPPWVLTISSRSWVRHRSRGALLLWKRSGIHSPPKKHYRPCFSDSIRKHKVWSWEIDWMWASVYLHVWLMLRLPCLINVILILRLAFQKLLIQIQKFFFQMTNILEFPIAFQVHIGLYLRCWKKYPAEYRS